MIHIKEQENGINAQNDTDLHDNAYSNILDQLCKRSVRCGFQSI